MATRLTKEQRRGLTRTALLDAAERAFAERGFHAASLDEIAEDAGFTRGAIYSNFDGKEDLLLQVMQRRLNQAIESFESAIGTATLSDRSTWSSFVDAWRQAASEDPQALALRLEFTLLALRNPTVAERLAEYEHEVENTMTELLVRRAETEGLQLPLEAKVLGPLLYVATQGLHEHQAVCRQDHGELFAALLDLLVPRPSVTSPLSS